MQALLRHKHLVLLVSTIAAMALQPMMRNWLQGVILFELLGYGLMLAVFFTVFERRSHRRIALALAVAAVGANFVGHVTVDRTQLIAYLVFHSLSALFLGIAVGIILRGVFRSKRIGAEQIFGGAAGYLLSGVAWSNLYLLVYYLAPDGAFNVAPGLAWQLEIPETRRFLFNYFSFITLTTMGYGDVTPLVPAACTLAWLEAAFGQFYLAVLIGQLVGLKLVQSPAPSTHA